jgi:hypothetical protein
MLELSVLMFFSIMIIVIFAFSRRITEQDRVNQEDENSDQYNKPKRGGF